MSRSRAQSRRPTAVSQPANPAPSSQDPAIKFALNLGNHETSSYDIGELKLDAEPRTIEASLAALIRVPATNSRVSMRAVGGSVTMVLDPGYWRFTAEQLRAIEFTSAPETTIKIFVGPDLPTYLGAS